MPRSCAASAAEMSTQSPRASRLRRGQSPACRSSAGTRSTNGSNLRRRRSSQGSARPSGPRSGARLRPLGRVSCDPLGQGTRRSWSASTRAFRNIGRMSLDFCPLVGSSGARSIEPMNREPFERPRRTRSAGSDPSSVRVRLRRASSSRGSATLRAKAPPDRSRPLHRSLGGGRRVPVHARRRAPGDRAGRLRRARRSRGAVPRDPPCGALGAESLEPRF
jgi:hypothetical protein